MELLEIWADEHGETHFRRSRIAFEASDYAPPSKPVQVSADMRMSVGKFLVAPPGWDKTFHPTPRRQFAVLLSGRVTITATDGETASAGPGSIVLLNDQDSKGHLTRVQEDQDAVFLLVAVED